VVVPVGMLIVMSGIRANWKETPSGRVLGTIKKARKESNRG
jgi:hypothetical protein